MKQVILKFSASVIGKGGDEGTISGGQGADTPKAGGTKMEMGGMQAVSGRGL